MDRKILLFALVAAIIAGDPAPASETPKSLLAEKGEWRTWGGDAGFQRYSPLEQINARNAKRLKVAWRWSALSLGDAPDANWKATPLFVDGRLFVPTGVNQVVALDPATGREIWRFSPDPLDIGGRELSISSRGLAFWTDGKAERLFHNTPDGRLISIDARTGRADPTFGDNGYVILREHLRPDGKPAPFVGSSSPATVVGDIVIVQVVADVVPSNKEATPGHIRGYDARTGKLVWTFHTIPQPGEFGAETWEDGSNLYTGNTGVWSMMSADLELGYVYLPVESPSNDFYGGQRKGDGLFGESLVCLDAKTGERVWHFQLVHHGLWDYDPPAAPILHDIHKDGRTIKAVTQLTKQGMVFVFNRETGQPIWPIEERAAPQAGGAPGERPSPTQPFPTRPAPYLPLGYAEDTLIDFTPALRADAIRIAERYVKGPIYTPPTPLVKGGTQGTWVQPGFNAGANWNGGAFDPRSGMMYVPIRNTPNVASLAAADPALTNWDWIRGPIVGGLTGPQGLPILKPPYSFVVATDMNRGEHVWRRSIGGAPDWIRNHPALKGLKLDFANMGQPMVRPAPLVTKTLLFLGEAGHLFGDPGGPMFRAYDKATGAVMAEIQLPEKATGAPMTYWSHGRQYIAIAVSSASHPAELVALALPDGRKRQTAKAPSAAPDTSIAAPASGSANGFAQGRAVFDRTCAVCHGPPRGGMPVGAPQLTGMRDATAVARKIRAGGVEMPPMAAMLTDADIEAVSRFVAAGSPRP
ncbi:MAG: PQQ-binding-like beta-propeller repeat protein [Phenylobacterium sp.]